MQKSEEEMVASCLAESPRVVQELVAILLGDCGESSNLVRFGPAIHYPFISLHVHEYLHAMR
jgi:hypothetical protein